MKYYISILLFVFMFPFFAMADTALDSDGDGIMDADEINIYKTDPNVADSDGDGYSDWIELNKGFSPLTKENKKLEEVDTDKDGLSDRMELRFKTDLSDPDTDDDGYKDGAEIKAYFDPLSKEAKKLPKRLEVSLGGQMVYYFLGGVRMGYFKISSGKASMPTPKGHYKIINKAKKVWSDYGLWMPYWMGMGTGKFGFHELPIWPNGYREGENHLGIPVSHGCVRLGVGSAKFLYDWAEVGTPVFIY